ncbi:MAG TPA: decaprenyl-phosphate phosphoribosyltransferase [Acidimicrobiales bacterium]|nr:decaprenyl-phosphate phosphoribosyltransferase [Acidimicrobiales bacterium]
MTNPEIEPGAAGTERASLAGLASSDQAAPAAPRSPQTLSKGLLREARPKQWVKNVLVFAAPGAAGALTHLHPLLVTIGTFGVFCLAASGTYFVNDAMDVAADRSHPTKRYRPIAAGVVPLPLAWAVGLGLLLAGVGLSYALAGADLTIVVASYVAITLAYSAFLKHEAVLDLAAVAAGFLLRAIAGGVAVHVPLSDWFVIVASFGSLFMVAGKRYAEHRDLGEARSGHRATLATYSLGFLRYVRSLSSAVAIAAYCLWAFEKARPAGGAAIWFELSIAPFVLAILRYALLLDAGQGAAPEEVVLSDRTLQLLGVAWILLFAFGVYGL